MATDFTTVVLDFPTLGQYNQVNSEVGLRANQSMHPTTEEIAEP
jgi:hypothetical protein